MKSPIPVVFFILVLTLSNQLYSQATKTQSNPFSNIETGSKKYYLVRLADGQVIKAKVVSVDPKKVLLISADGNSHVIDTKEVVTVTEHSFNSPGSIGIGFGMPYGIFGVNTDIKLYNFLYGTAGIGTAIYITPVYNVGLRCFLAPGTKTWRPRASVYYGNTAFMVLEGNYQNPDIQEVFNGISVGLGMQYSIDIAKAIGFDFELIYIVDDSEFEDRIAEVKSMGYQLDFESAGNVKICIGVRYVF